MPPAVTSFTVQAGPAVTAASKTLSCQGNVCLLAGLNSATMSSGVVATVTMTLSPSAAGTSVIQINNPVEAELDGTAGLITAAGGSISAIIPVAVGLTPAAVSLQESQTQQFTATVTGATNTAVNWSLSPSVGTVSAAGLYTAPATITAPQTVTITASSAADTSKSASATITLQPVVVVSLAPGNMSVSAAQTQQFTATVTGTTNTAVNWSLSPNVGTVSATGLYTAPASLSAPQTVTITATSAADTSKVATALILLQPANGFAIRVNAGGPLYNDTQGQSWNADFGYDTGSVSQTNASVLGTTDPALYQTARYGDFRYRFGVPNGAYSLTLKFAETAFSQSGQRVFNVLLNGSMVLANFDILGQGIPPLTAVDRTFPVNITDGQITIEFDSVVNAAQINAIVITQAPPPNISVAPASAMLSASQTQQFTATQGAGAASVAWSLQPAVGSITQTGLYTAPAAITTAQTVTISAVSSLDPAKSGTAIVSLQPAPVSAFTPIRVNAGGRSYTDNTGQVWIADSGYTGGSTFHTSNSILNTTTPDLYQTQRTGDFRYQFSVPNGAYVVTLKFAEIKFGRARKRTFNVSINGAPVLANFDVFQNAGGDSTALDRSFPVTVSTGKITIQFTGVVNDAIVNAIQITAAP